MKKGNCIQFFEEEWKFEIKFKILYIYSFSRFEKRIGMFRVEIHWFHRTRKIISKVGAIACRKRERSFRISKNPIVATSCSLAHLYSPLRLSQRRHALAFMRGKDASFRASGTSILFPLPIVDGGVVETIFNLRPFRFTRGSFAPLFKNWMNIISS